jgi:hypothetical protein
MALSNHSHMRGLSSAGTRKQARNLRAVHVLWPRLTSPPAQPVVFLLADSIGLASIAPSAARHDVCEADTRQPPAASASGVLLQVTRVQHLLAVSSGCAWALREGCLLTLCERVPQ